MVVLIVFLLAPIQ